MTQPLTLESWYILIPLFFVFLFVLVRWAKSKNRTYTTAQYVLLVTFGIYLLAVLHLVFFPIELNFGPYANQTPWYKTINLIPLLTLDVKSFVLNILMLVPLGIYLPLLKPTVTSIRKAAIFALRLSVTFELLQLIMRITLGNGRSTDINDLIANTLGGALGFLLFTMLSQGKTVQRLSAAFKQ